MKLKSSGRMLGGVIGALLVVSTLGAIAMTSGRAVADDGPEQATPVSHGSNPSTSGWSGPTPTPDIAAIAIRVVDPPETAWVQVQWSTWEELKWYPVVEWSGPLSQNDYGWGAVWYGPKDYGTGPFRWVVFDRNPAEGGQVWGMSKPFYLDYVGTFDLTEILKGQNLPKPVPTATPDPRMTYYAPQGAVLKANPEGCDRYAIGGEVLAASGRPLSGYRLRLTYPSGKTEIVKAGGAPNYGPSGFGYLLGGHRLGQTYKLDLLPMDGTWPIASPVTISFSDNCQANYAWVVFQSKR